MGFHPQEIIEVLPARLSSWRAGGDAPSVDARHQSDGRTKWRVILDREVGPERDAVLKVIKASNPDLSDPDVSALLSAQEVVVGRDLSRDEANAVMLRLQEAGIPARKYRELQSVEAA